jgi:hypothetical protein
MIIGITGYAKVGKDTFYKLLSESYTNNFMRFGFADELKRDLFELVRDQFGWDIFDLKGEQKEVIRPIMIAYGCAWRKVDGLHWVKIIDEKLKHYNKNFIPVITDVRFENESKFFRDKYGKDFILIKINREGAPIPPDEELKNQPLVDNYVDITLNWHTVGDEISLLKPQVEIIYNKLIKKEI